MTNKQPTQEEIAHASGVSLSSVRRWLTDPTKVGKATRTKCESAVAKLTGPKRRPQMDAHAMKFEHAWRTSEYLSPRQAFRVASWLATWGEDNMAAHAWDNGEAIHEISPFSDWDKRLLFPVDGNRTWFDYAVKRMAELAEYMERGWAPGVEMFAQGGMFSLFDELAFATAVAACDEPGLDSVDDMIEHNPEWVPGEREDDADWDSVLNTVFDGEVLHYELIVGANFPVIADRYYSPLDIAEARKRAGHPFEWFDTTPTKQIPEDNFEAQIDDVVRHMDEMRHESGDDETASNQE